MDAVAKCNVGNSIKYFAQCYFLLFHDCISHLHQTENNKNKNKCDVERLKYFKMKNLLVVGNMIQSKIYQCRYPNVFHLTLNSLLQTYTCL